ncbi:MAG: hypothetical protein Q7R40_17115 [Phaeospirillum sp.]|nr:hypothetical protein [Phaeospirillum sp.]
MENHIAGQYGGGENGPIRAELALIDKRKARPLGAIVTAQAAGLEPDPADVQALADLEATAADLRSRLVP